MYLYFLFACVYIYFSYILPGLNTFGKFSAVAFANYRHCQTHFVEFSSVLNDMQKY